ncbi:MAG: hypothetical protein ACLSVG_03025 [Clostridia bacterium]
MKNNRQNPLGIISIFASLAEVFGTIVLKFLPNNIQLIFVWFVICFPVLIVVLFFFVLFKKPENFYSPDYYKNDNNFLQAIRKTLSNLGNEVANDGTVPQEIREKVQQKINLTEEELSEFDNVENENKISLIIDGTKIEANTVKSFYRSVFDYLTENDIDFEQLLPFKTGSKRYLISKDGKHINGKAFFAPIIYDGYYIETHKSKNGAKSDIIKFLNKLNLNVESG